MSNFLSYALLGLLAVSADSNLNHSKVTELEKEIFRDYNPTIIPTNNEALNLSMGVAFRAFNNIDQKEGIISLNLWLRYRWTDYNLAWNETEWNISSLIVSTDTNEEIHVWTPDIYLYNTAETPLENLKYSNVEISSDGSILWSRPGIIQSTCSFDMTDFPYDLQSCELKFGSWSYTGKHLILTETTPTIDMTNYQENGEWQIRNYNFEINSIKYACCPDKYYDITFSFDLQRLAGYYEINIIIPTFATASLILITLLIPWSSGERISFAVTVMLSIIVFLLILSDTLPKSNQQPLLSRMIMALTFFSLFGVFFTVLISALNNYKDEKLKGKTEIDNKFVRWLYNLFSSLCILKKNKSCLQKDNLSESSETMSYDVVNYQNISNNLIENENKTKINKTDSDSDSDKIATLLESLGNKENIEIRSTSYSNALRNRNINAMAYNQSSSNEDSIESNIGINRVILENEQDKKDTIQEECERMISILENGYSVIFLISFIFLCIFMFSSKPS